MNKAEYISYGGKCANQFHGDCVLSEEEKEKYFIQLSNDKWYCKDCVLFLQGGSKWGEMIGFDEISSKLDAMYDEIICWRLNLFDVPRGKAGKDFIEELNIEMYVRLQKCYRSCNPPSKGCIWMCYNPKTTFYLVGIAFSLPYHTLFLLHVILLQNYSKI